MRTASNGKTQTMQDISRFMGGNDCVEVESRGTGTARTWPSTSDAETSVGPQWSRSSQPVENDAVLCSLFGCNQVEAERGTDQHESLPWFRRQNEERRLSNIRAEMFRVAPLLTRHPKTARLRQTIARIRGEQDGRANAFGQFFARLTAVATASGERAASKPPLSCSSMEMTGPAGELTLSIKIHDS